MADEVLFRPGTVKEQKPVSNKVLMLIIITLLFFIVVELVFHLLIAPNLTLARVIVESDLDIANEEILRQAGITGEEYFFSVDCADLSERLEEMPMVKSALVEKSFPDTLRIILSSRKALGLSFAVMNGVHTPLVFDEEGVVFKAGLSEETAEMPVVSGLKFEDFNIGNKLPEKLLPLLEDLKELKLSSPVLYSLISEIRVSPRSDGGIDIILYPIHKRLPVRIGSSIDKEMFTSILRVMDVLDRQGAIDSMEEIDFRSGEIVYIMKEG